MYSKLQYISQGDTLPQQYINIHSALDAGCDWVQLRVKNVENESLLISLAEKVKKICQEYKATYIINDSVEIAHMIDADGVHLGLTDRSISEARAILGSSKIIGGTANTLEDVRQRITEKCDYIGLGPLRYTSTKVLLSPILGFEGFREILKNLQTSNFSTPIYAIGGIDEKDIIQLLQSGVYGVAISGIITNSIDKKYTVQQFREALNVIT